MTLPLLVKSLYTVQSIWYLFEMIEVEMCFHLISVQCNSYAYEY